MLRPPVSDGTGLTTCHVTGQGPSLRPPLHPLDPAAAAQLRVECAQLQAAARLLGLPEAALLAAASFLLRYRCTARSALPAREVVPAALFLALKVQETARRTSDLLQAVAADAPVLVGDAYYERKAELCAAELALLKALGFELGTPLEPHQQLLNQAAQQGAPAGLVRVACAALRDALLTSHAAQRHSAAALGGGALLVAGALLGREAQPGGPPCGDAWAGGDCDAAADIAAALVWHGTQL